ncbi:MAG: response regulator transcription factor [Lentisphaerae bacterium]|jgi:two-component system, NarL family, invasion response regulator UvrY|nr:response regulator transcription factor [Lentisphaerota bacterium]MBT4818598.1 response regulator transcription factor [Lentisphaerota bacterium]MBT5604505.1 response regulator transcription factor [Lentisphaerota bacterium]MBT7060506.1 response regulator transcription factor [Lentisphaerota bacterium]MBT7844413.1 response regulator transcription factor [Lentisphaerota bacterium]
MTTLIISADAATRTHLRAVLARCSDIDTVSEADSAEPPLVGDPHTVILADVSDETKGVPGTLRGIRARYPRASILALGSYCDSRFAVRALHAGANAYVLRERSSEDLAGALRAVDSGRVYVSPGIAGIAAGD